MADLPTIPLTFGNFGNALASGAQAAYYNTRSRVDQAEEQRKQDAQQYVQPAIQGDQGAMGRLAYGNPSAALAVTGALSRLDANQRANVQAAAEYSARAANAILQANPQDRPALYQQLYNEGKSRGYDMSGLPPQYSPQIDGLLRSHRAMGQSISDYYKQQLEMPQPMYPQGIGAGGGGGAAVPAGGGANGAAIAGTESAGQPNNGYGAVGPVATPQGNRAYGRYQVLDSNIGPWTQEILGKAMTPQEFLSNPAAQDKVFEAKFGQYVTKYGSPQAASRAWFAGEGGMNNPNATDVNGMTPGRYEQQFTANGGGQGAPPQVGGFAPPDVARNTQSAGALPQGVQIAGPPQAAPSAQPPQPKTIGPLDPVTSDLEALARGGFVPAAHMGVQMKGPNGGYLYILPGTNRTIEYKPADRVQPPQGFQWVPGQEGKALQPIPGGPGDPAHKEMALEGDPMKEGQDYLATLPPQRQAQFQAWMQGRDKPSQRMMTTPQGKQLLDEFYKAFPNDYDTVLNGQRADTVKDFANGKSSVTVANLNQAISHGVGLVNAFANLKNSGGFGGPVLNYIGNQVAHAGDSGPQGAFDINRKAFVDELAGVFKMTGATDSEIRAWDQTLSMNDTPATFNAKMGKALELLQGRLDSLANKYEIGTKTTLRQAGDLLSPQARQQLQYIESKIGGASPEPSMTGAAPSTPPSAPQAAPASVPKPGNYRWTPQGMVPQ